jgi:hypothetical protein
MSLVYNPILLAELAKIAQQAETPAPVRQPISTTIVRPEQITDIATKLFHNLQSNVSEQGQPTFTAETGNAELSTKHLVSLPNLLNFLQTNGISYNGMKLVIPHATQAFSSAGQSPDQYKSLTPEQQKLYAKYPDVQGDNFQYWVFKDGLLKYMQDLQAKASENTPGARILRLYLDKLVSQISDELEIDFTSAKSEQAGQAGQTQQKEQAGQGQAGAQNVAWQPGQPLSPQQTKALAPITNVYPFLPDRIDFRWIDQWLNTYFQVMQNFRGANPGLQPAQTAKQYVEIILNGYGVPVQRFTDTAVDIYNKLKTIAQQKSMEPNAAMEFPRLYLEYVAKLVSFLGDALAAFKSTLPPNWEDEKLDEQISNSASSLAYLASSSVQQWLNNLPAAQRQVENANKPNQGR